jgi:hypothetical protein
MDDSAYPQEAVAAGGGSWTSVEEAEVYGPLWMAPRAEFEVERKLFAGRASVASASRRHTGCRYWAMKRRVPNATKKPVPHQQ